ncbi:MAG: hypothetical protein H3C43_11915 [Leptonema sp. (in: Bacteria)]|nr:hypothetical protein [Leptonema sp. (in: bacteria)]
MAEPFRELIPVILKGDLTDLKSNSIWLNFINSWSIERTLSRSGNPHWHFIKYYSE